MAVSEILVVFAKKFIMSVYGTDGYNEIAYGNTLSTGIWDIGVWGLFALSVKKDFAPAKHEVRPGDVLGCRRRKLLLIAYMDMAGENGLE